MATDSTTMVTRAELLRDLKRVLWSSWTPVAYKSTERFPEERKRQRERFLRTQWYASQIQYWHEVVYHGGNPFHNTRVSVAFTYRSRLPWPTTYDRSLVPRPRRRLVLSGVHNRRIYGLPHVVLQLLDAAVPDVPPSVQRIILEFTHPWRLDSQEAAVVSLMGCFNLLRMVHCLFMRIRNTTVSGATGSRREEDSSVT